MTSVDTNILLYALHERVSERDKARNFIYEMSRSDRFVICELALMELYQLIRNPRVFGRDLSETEVKSTIQLFRTHPKWRLVEEAPIMSKVWDFVYQKKVARRRIFDIRLAFTLQHHGVREFATNNVKDFQDLGFERVFNPLEA